MLPLDGVFVQTPSVKLHVFVMVSHLGLWEFTIFFFVFPESNNLFDYLFGVGFLSLGKRLIWSAPGAKHATQAETKNVVLLKHGNIIFFFALHSLMDHHFFVEMWELAEFTTKEWVQSC